MTPWIGGLVIHTGSIPANIFLGKCRIVGRVHLFAKEEWGKSHRRFESCHFRVKNNELDKANENFEKLKKVLLEENVSEERAEPLDLEALYNTRGTKNEYFSWAEGYRATGESGDAPLMYSEPIYAHSFNEAVEILKARDSNPSLFRKSEYGTWSYWGCKLFDNEADARVSFG